jgi:hypothetical protein
MAVTAIAALLGSCSYVQRGVLKMEWTATVSGVGNFLDAPHLPDKTVHIKAPSTISGTSRIIIEGTNGAPSDGPWTTLTTPTDGLLDYVGIVTSMMKVIRENPLYIRPRYETVTAGESLNVVIISR